MTRVAAIAALLGATAVEPRVSVQPPSPPASLGRAAIAGRVTDSFGDPAVNVIVTVESLGENGATRGAGLAETDDRGEYRIGRLPAGRYVVSVFRMDSFVNNPIGPREPQRTYYPGARSAADAETIALDTSDVRDDVDVAVEPPALLLPPVAAIRQQQLAAGRVSLPPGAAIVRGRVVTTAGSAVPRAQVRLLPADITQTRAAAADADGRFEFRDVAPGALRLIAGKPGYESVGAAPAIEVKPEETRDGVELRLVRWSTMSGIVTGDRGEPVAGARVQLLRLGYDGGRRRLLPTGFPRQTNDLGRYRLYPVAPGQYVVSAALAGFAPAESDGYAPSYYPGAAQPASAQFVSVAASQNVDGIDIQLARAHLARVAGKVLSPDGDPVRPTALALNTSVRSASAVSLSMGASVANDGSFEFRNVPPGQYVIRTDRGRSQPWIEGEFGTLPVVVEAADVTNLVVPTSSGSSVTGRITFLGHDNTKVPAASALELRPLVVDVDAAPNSVATAKIHDDWTFEMSGLNGARRLTLTRVPPGWSLQEIRVRGIDVADRALPFGRREQSLAGVEVILRDRVSELSGAVVDADARPQAGAAVIVFASDRARWYPGTRYMQRTAAAADGAFTIAGLPFGNYYVAAVAAAKVPADGDDWQDPAFLETLIPRAASVTVAEGDKQIVRLTASP